MSATTTKTRTPWDNDSAAPGGKTSIAILLEWLSAPGNSDRWRFGDVRHRDASSGRLSTLALGPQFSKIELAREVLRCMDAQGITHRLARDVRWKINALLRSYAAAAQFLSQYEQQKRTVLQDAASATDAQQAIASSEPRVMNRVYTLCPYFDILDPVLSGSDLSDLQLPPAAAAAVGATTGNSSKKLKREPLDKSATAVRIASVDVSSLAETQEKDNAQEDDDDGDEQDELDDDPEDDAIDSDDHEAADAAAAAHLAADGSRTSDLFVMSTVTHKRKRTDANDADATSTDNSNSNTNNNTNNSSNSTQDHDSAMHQRRKRQAEAQFTQRRRALVLENLEIDLAIKQVQREREQLLLAKERALSRAQLAQAGIAPREIDAVVTSHSFLTRGASE